jgi:hypothetical protein
MGLNLLETTYKTLTELGAVQTRSEFCREWLGRGEGYVRMLRHHNQPPSIDVISVLCDRLRFYKQQYSEQGTKQDIMVAKRYERLADECEQFVNSRSRSIWQSRALEAI